MLLLGERKMFLQFTQQARLIVLGTVKGIQKADCIHISCRILANAAHLCKQAPESPKTVFTMARKSSVIP
jgi:hypothetical protein